MKTTPLTAAAWIEAAFRALTAGGPQAIRAEAIARDLKVSKGSFYWHFKNVAALKAGMLKHWQKHATEAIIEGLEKRGSPATDKLRQLVDAATSEAASPYGGVLAEAAIRDWARYDSHAAATVKEVDYKRLVYLEKLFQQSGAGKAASHRNATLLYSALIGLELLSHQGLADLRQDLHAQLDILLDRG